MELQRRKVLVTGGATGIGFGLSARFVQEGSTVIACGRRQSALDEAARKIPDLITCAFDLTQAGQRQALFDWVMREHPDLDVLVNNAGIQNWMHVSDTDFMARADRELETNVRAPLHLTSLFLESGALRTIMNVTSGLSFVPLVRVPVYSATKAFFHSFTLSLREQVRERGIEVIEVVPPALNTDLGGPGLHDHAPPVAAFIDAIFEQLTAGSEQVTFGFSEAMARAGQDVLGETFARMNAAPTR